MPKPSSPPSLSFLGPVRITRAGAPVALPRSQKTRALLAYLVLTRRAHRRERLCEMFWDVTDDPRGALRWSLSKLRALDDEANKRIRADRDAVAFEPAGAIIDVLELDRALAAGVSALDTAALRAAVALYRGSLLEDLELPGFEEFQAWRVAERERYRRLHVELLRALCQRLTGDPEQALAPARELVRLLPDDEEARAALVTLLFLAGRREEAGEHGELGLQQIARQGADRGVLRRALRDASIAAPVAASPAPIERDLARQEIRFCTSRDGVRLAYATLGEGPVLVKTANWLTHLEYDWKSPLWRHLARDLSRDFRLIRYDQRGNGLSDRDVSDFSLEACVADLEAVVDTAGLTRFPLLGVSQGCRVAIAFAVKHPERVSRMVLYGGAARGWKHRDPAVRETRAALQPLIQRGWEGELVAFRQVFTTLFMPDASPEQARWFNELQAASTSAQNAHRLTEASSEVDVSDLLAQVRAPTLVMHATRDAMTPFDEARRLSAGIPDARFVALDSNNHLLLDDEPAFARFLTEIRAFLGDADRAA